MKKRTLLNLVDRKGKIYVYCSNSMLIELFLNNAETEGFLYSDGVKPTEREADNLYRITSDRTIYYVGWGGHMLFKLNGIKTVEPVYFIDYEKYLFGERRYILKQIRPSFRLIRNCKG